MTRWFRVYDDILDDPKVQLLSPELFKTWVNLLAVASRNAGKLPPAHQLAFALRLGAQDMQSRLDELILAGLIDIAADGSMEPHNWSKRQWKSDDSAERVRKHRAKKSAETSGNIRQAVTETDGNDRVTVTVTPPDTESDTEDRGCVDTRTREVDRLAEQLQEAAGSALANPAAYPGLLSLSTPRMWLEQGADLDRDVLPTLRSVAERRKRANERITTWDYFTAAVANAKARRERGLTPTETTLELLRPKGATPFAQAFSKMFEGGSHEEVRQ
jgi:hypothetical protein